MHIIYIRSKLMIGEDGQTAIRFRIEDVSKSHQKQAFQIQVSADTTKAPGNCDISPAIWSKVNPFHKIHIYALMYLILLF